MLRADELVAKTLQIISYFRAHWCIENPANSLLWKREVARGLLENSVVTSYCCFPGHNYRKNTRIANSFGLTLPSCQGAGHCPAMVGKRHKEYAQRGCNIKIKGSAERRSHTLDELHSIPKDLIEEIFRQLL